MCEAFCITEREKKTCLEKCFRFQQCLDQSNDYIQATRQCCDECSQEEKTKKLSCAIQCIRLRAHLNFFFCTRPRL